MFVKIILGLIYALNKFGFTIKFNVDPNQDFLIQSVTSNVRRTAAGKFIQNFISTTEQFQ